MKLILSPQKDTFQQVKDVILCLNAFWTLWTIYLKWLLEDSGRRLIFNTAAKTEYYLKCFCALTYVNMKKNVCANFLLLNVFIIKKHLMCKHCKFLMNKSEYGKNQVYVDYFILFGFCWAFILNVKKCVKMCKIQKFRHQIPLK